MTTKKTDRVTFRSAQRQVAKLADGRLHGLNYSFTKYASGTTEALCGVYIDGQDWQEAPTWKEAIRKMDIAINGEPEADLEEAPR